MRIFQQVLQREATYPPNHVARSDLFTYLSVTSAGKTGSSRQKGTTPISAMDAANFLYSPAWMQRTTPSFRRWWRWRRPTGKMEDHLQMLAAPPGISQPFLCCTTIIRITWCLKNTRKWLSKRAVAFRSFCRFSENALLNLLIYDSIRSVKLHFKHFII